MELNYDATVYFLYRKHGGDMEKVLRSFRAFLKFAATLGNEECAQLEHVDEFYYTEEVLRSRVGYWEWKVGEMRRVKKERKQKYEKDTVFGGTAVPSGHNVFKDSLKGRLDEIAAEVRTMLPTIDDSDSDSAGSIPEVFFSGVDWSKTKLPGDEGFHWDSSDNDVDDKADPPSMPPSRTPHQGLAKEVLPPSTLLPPSTITSQLDSLPTETLATQLRSGDMSALKRALNPNRPLRPSQCRYDEDGNPLDGIEPATTDDADDAAMLKEFMEKAKQPDQPSTAPQRGGRWTIIEHSDSSDDDDCHNLKGGKGKGYKGAGGKGSKVIKRMLAAPRAAVNRHDTRLGLGDRRKMTSLQGRNPLQGVTTALPKLVGCSFPELNQPVTHRKKQLLVKSGNRTDMVGTKERGVEHAGGAEKKLNAEKIGNMMPEWQTLDKKALRFYAYFREPVQESRVESDRLRKLVILYYLEDDTMQVSEPRQQNSGILQGSFIKRHRVMKNEKEHMDLHDLTVGATITIYGKAMLIVDCDAFTREFYSRAGIDQPEAIFVPEDSHEQWQIRARQPRVKDPELKRVMDLDASQRAGGTVHKLSSEAKELSKTFYMYDRKVLRFNCEWKDPSVHGETHALVLLYFLADKTCVVSEFNPPNSGKDPFPTFLKRQKIPKAGCPAQGVSLETISSKYRSDQFYTEKDLYIGARISVFGRELKICSMDPATQQYYRANHGHTDFTPIPIDLPTKPAPPVPKPPPHSGIGNEEDSLGSWKHLVLKPPRRDQAKELRDSDKVLRFRGSMLSSHPTDQGRKFIVCFYLADGTVQIFEQPCMNSGLTGGKFLCRQRVKVGTDDNGGPVYLRDEAFRVGNVVEVLGSKFVLEEMDERTEMLLGGVERGFDAQRLNEVLKKLKEFTMIRHSSVTDAFRFFDRDHSGGITLNELRQVLFELQIKVTDEELLTLMEYFDVNGDGVISYPEFVETMIDQDYTDPEEPADKMPIKQPARDGMRSTEAQSKADQEMFRRRVFNMFTEKLTRRKAVLLESFRAIADASQDGLIGEKEFRDCINRTMQLFLTKAEEDALVHRFFFNQKTGQPNSRLNLKMFTAIYENRA